MVPLRLISKLLIKASSMDWSSDWLVDINNKSMRFCIGIKSTEIGAEINSATEKGTTNPHKARLVSYLKCLFVAYAQAYLILYMTPLCKLYKPSGVTESPYSGLIVFNMLTIQSSHSGFLTSWIWPLISKALLTDAFLRNLCPYFNAVLGLLKRHVVCCPV